ncbi:MAG: beta-galactosidase [Clostridia bacterium]|nr:beta-galactosidase [Clostridia bacterium]
MENVNVPRNEYPRPQFMRGCDSWMNLNGKWEFELDLSASGSERHLDTAEHLSGEITVPFVPESDLSGVGYTDFVTSVWYKRRIELSGDALGGRVLLHFGAVDDFATVWINGSLAGCHRGGYTPFTLDITALVNEGANTITVHAEDDVKDVLQPSGKQSARWANYSCFYTRSTGIWQTVWLEFVPKTYIKTVKIIPDVANEKADVTVIFDGYENVKELRAVAAFDGDEVSAVDVNVTGKSVTFALPITDPVLWDIGKGNLYDLCVTAGDDMLSCYFGMRSVEVDGYKVRLNGRSIFQRLVLDQGYFEKGIYTAESDEDFERDIKLSMSAGFNGARMHMKVFEPRFIYHADRLGYLLWGEFANWGLDTTKDGAFGRMAPAWREEIERDISSPAIIGWCPLNEVWTRDNNEFVRNMFDLTKTLDPSRPVIDISGFMHSDVTDIYDVHDYVQEVDEFRKHYDPLVTGEGEAYVNYPDFEKRDPNIPYFVSEFGGTFWDPNESDDGGDDQNNSWGYGKKPDSREEFYSRFEGLVSTLLDNERVCGFCYTQFTDVMQEQNGVFRFDRTPKFDTERLRAIVSRRAAIED